MHDRIGLSKKRYIYLIKFSLHMNEIEILSFFQTFVLISANRLIAIDIEIWWNMAHFT